MYVCFVSQSFYVHSRFGIIIEKSMCWLNEKGFFYLQVLIQLVAKSNSFALNRQK